MLFFFYCFLTFFFSHLIVYPRGQRLHSGFRHYGHVLTLCSAREIQQHILCKFFIPSFRLIPSFDLISSDLLFFLCCFNSFHLFCTPSLSVFTLFVLLDFLQKRYLPPFLPLTLSPSLSLCLTNSFFLPATCSPHPLTLTPYASSLPFTLPATLRPHLPPSLSPPITGPH